MHAKCWWEAAQSPGRCVVAGCPKEARAFCHVHPDEGYFCARHRNEHAKSVAKRNAELDSRPREPERVRRLVENLVDIPGVMRELMSEASRRV